AKSGTLLPSRRRAKKRCAMWVSAKNRRSVSALWLRTAPTEIYGWSYYSRVGGLRNGVRRSPCRVAIFSDDCPLYSRKQTSPGAVVVVRVVAKSGHWAVRHEVGPEDNISLRPAPCPANHRRICRSGQHAMCWLSCREVCAEFRS